MNSVKNIGHTLKVAAWWILGIGELGGLMWFITSVSNYTQYQDFIDFKYITSEYTVLAQQGQTGIIFSLVAMFTVFITFLLMYGFGEIIDCLQETRKATQEQNAILIQKLFNTEENN